MFQKIDVSSIVQIDLRFILMGTVQSSYRLEYALQGLQISREILIVRDPGVIHISFPRCSYRISIVNRRTLTGMLWIFWHVQVANQFWLRHFNICESIFLRVNRILSITVARRLCSAFRMPRELHTMQGPVVRLNGFLVSRYPSRTTFCGSEMVHFPKGACPKVTFSAFPVVNRRDA